MKLNQLSVAIVFGVDCKWHVVNLVRYATMVKGVLLIIEKDKVLERFEDKENARAFCAQIGANVVRAER